MNKLFIILGPTSSGKTSLGFDLCKKYNGEIISADSRQIYKYMDIGTGKTPIDVSMHITKKDTCWTYDGVNVWGYDLITPDKYFSAYDFGMFALSKAEELLIQNKNLFLIGGTGFYIDMFTGVTQPSNISPDFQIREKLESQTLKELQETLSRLDPKTYKHIDIANKVRLIRAIEKATSVESNQPPLPYLTNTEFVFIGLNAPREYLYKRVDAWTDKVWLSGLIEETKNLLDLGYGDSLKMKGLNYKTAISYLSGDMPLVEAIARTKFDNHAYIRRQQTYFKLMDKKLVTLGKSSITWIDISQDNYKETVYNIING